MKVDDITAIVGWEFTTGKKYPHCKKCDVLYADYIDTQLCEFCTGG